MESNFDRPSLAAWLMFATALLGVAAGIADGTADGLYFLMAVLICAGGGFAGRDIAKWLGRSLHLKLRR